ncbi:polyhydroxyalkanoic acid system family protein [Botrimarina hoheduenensis]|uniref:Putative polyhydroxyalkanoic acid system protein n=1 Tax=Botrimarina hoheduenensis TaxID=2528000 RepID=A0A5C5WEB7_9BACT|nr:polyhydroxyalkanoic acid system family protein [Botrimarina hoheduenensis]TWT48493.1 putative polyhydroxyalkanoic acid system protein [Botrimarina hoheduenensis]
MPKFEVSIPHNLGREQARDRLHGFSDMLRAKYSDQLSGLEQTWEGDTLSFGFTTFGFKIQGNLAVEDAAIRVSGDLPFAAAMFKGKITGAIEEQLNRLLK